MEKTRRSGAPGMGCAAMIAGLVALVVATAAAARLPGAEVRDHVRAGVPRTTAECMVQLGASRGECEVGEFTGAYAPAWDSIPELVQVRDAVRRLPAAGGRWSFRGAGASGTVCAELPGRQTACAPDVRSALRQALQERQ